jgi:alpha-L-fucosidase
MTQPAPIEALLGARGPDQSWFQRDRFGMFIHWGPGALHPGEVSWARLREPISDSEYQKYIDHFDPDLYDPDLWIREAKKVGMRYAVLTTKHHDGFCLWDTKQTDYNTMNTPYGKDVLRMLADACHRRGVPLCLYYSVADWHQPNYPNQGRSHELQPQPGDQPDWSRYMEFLKAQVRELCTNYGEIGGFWWDMNVPKHVDPSVNEMIRKLQPKAVINNRGFDPGDFGTPERDYDASGEDAPIFSQRTEACQSVGSESWGYRKDEDYYDDRHLQRSIDKYLARDANYLLNVGPMPDGTIAARPAAILRRIGKWYASVKEAFEGTAPASNLTTNRNVLLTKRDNTLYVHLYKDPIREAVQLKPMATAPQRARLLNTGKPVEFAVDMVPSDHVEHKAYLRLRNLPVDELADTVLVVKVEF